MCYIIFTEIALFHEHNADFENFCTKIELKEQLFGKTQKVNFDLQTQLVPFDVLSHIYSQLYVTVSCMDLLSK